MSKKEKWWTFGLALASLALLASSYGCSFTLKDSGEFSIGYTSALVFKHHTAKTGAESKWGVDLAHSKEFIEGVHDVFVKPEGGDDETGADTNPG